MNRGFFETSLYISLLQYYEDYMLTNNFMKKSNIYKMDHFLDHSLDHFLDHLAIYAEFIIIGRKICKTFRNRKKEFLIL